MRARRLPRAVRPAGAAADTRGPGIVERFDAEHVESPHASQGHRAADTEVEDPAPQPHPRPHRSRLLGRTAAAELDLTSNDPRS